MRRRGLGGTGFGGMCWGRMKAQQNGRGDVGVLSGGRAEGCRVITHKRRRARGGPSVLGRGKS